jgi:hypothetical protein
MNEIKCKQCGKLFKPKNSKQIFCSHRCVALWRAKDGFPWGKRWTEAENLKLKELYPNNFDRDIAVILGRSVRAIKYRARELGLKKMSLFFSQATLRSLKKQGKKPWTDNDEDILRKLYPVESVEKVAKVLGRSIHAIKGRACVLGLKQERPFAKLGNRYLAKGIAEQEKVLAQLKAEGWTVIEPENSLESYDAIIKKDGKDGRQYIINVKCGKKFTVEQKSLERMMKFPYTPAVLYVTRDGERYFMEVTSF